MKKNKAFTLAEVLLTLVIIGVISALTLPIIKKVSDEHAYVAGVKKAYMTLAAVVKDIKSAEGAPRLWESNMLKKYFIKRLSIASETVSDYDINYLNGTAYDDFSFSNSFSTLDGMVWTVNQIAGCTDNVCGNVWIDVNGKSSPNTVGADVHLFYITPQGVFPYGGGPVVVEDNCSTTGNGTTCTARIIKEGKISW